MTTRPPRGVAAVPLPAPDDATAPRVLATLPAEQVNAARYNIDLQVGPRGARLVVMAGGIVIGHSGWSVDLDACWNSVAPILLPSFARVADAQCRPVDHDA